ncbi:unnamed protein product, partial [Bubo scandiacus]
VCSTVNMKSCFHDHTDCSTWGKERHYITARNILINLPYLTLSVQGAIEALKYLVPLKNPVTSYYSVKGKLSKVLQHQDLLSVQRKPCVCYTKDHIWMVALLVDANTNTHFHQLMKEKLAPLQWITQENARPHILYVKAFLFVCCNTMTKTQNAEVHRFPLMTMAILTLFKIEKLRVPFNKCGLPFFMCILLSRGQL